MRTTAQLRALWGPECYPHAKTELVVLHSTAKLYVHPLVADAFRALDQVAAHHGYAFRPGDTGAWNCRPITGGTGWSLHAFGIAGDFNWRTNPYSSRFVTDMPRAMVEDIERIRTKGGHRVFRWGGDWDDDNVNDSSVYDTMHFEVVASPAEMRTGIDWSTVAGGGAVPVTPPPPITPSVGHVDTLTVKLPALVYGDKGEDVRQLQQMLVWFGATIAVDGGFGDETLTAVRQVHTFHHITEVDLNGRPFVGPQTWALLLKLLAPTK